jgi:CheY-like chemotaxis protein
MAAAKTFVVDDDPNLIAALVSMLQGTAHVGAATSGVDGE